MQILTVGDAARLCGVGEGTIRYWTKVGRLAAIRTASGQRLFLREEVERVARERGAGR